MFDMTEKTRLVSEKQVYKKRPLEETECFFHTSLI